MCALTAYLWLNSSICLLARILGFLSASCLRRQSSIFPQICPNFSFQPTCDHLLWKGIKDKTPEQRAKCSMKQPLPTQEVEQNKCEEK